MALPQRIIIGTVERAFTLQHLDLDEDAIGWRHGRERLLELLGALAIIEIQRAHEREIEEFEELAPGIMRRSTRSARRAATTTRRLDAGTVERANATWLFLTHGRRRDNGAVLLEALVKEGVLTGDQVRGVVTTAQSDIRRYRHPGPALDDARFVLDTLLKQLSTL